MNISKTYAAAGAGSDKSAAQPDLSQYQFREILPDAPDHILAQLVNKDSVHKTGVGSIEDLREFRLGGEQFTRTCYAMMDGDKVLTAVYIHKNDGGRLIHDTDMCGDVDAILTEPSVQTLIYPDSLTAYSISNISDVRGIGGELISRLKNHMSWEYSQSTLNTLSPLRTFAGSASFARPIADPVKCKRDVLAHLVEGGNPVMKFHLSCGARIADIKLGAGDKSTDAAGATVKHPAMVNYGYDLSKEELAVNAALFATIAPCLKKGHTPSAEERFRIKDVILSLTSRELLHAVGIEAPCGDLQPLACACPPLWAAPPKNESLAEGPG
jgi:hypothetical protein